MSYTSKTISETIIDYVNRNTFLPAIQREYVWNTYSIEKLFDSIMCGYPISSFLFWKIREEKKKDWVAYQFVTDFDKTDPHNEEANLSGVNQDIYLVLDGQQRLTSLLIGLKGSYSFFYYRWRKTRLYLNLFKKPTNDDNPEELTYQFQFRENDSINANDSTPQYWYLVSNILDFNTASAARKDIREKLSNISVDSSFKENAVELIEELHSRLFTEKFINIYEEKSQELSNDMSYSTRLIFECDGEKYYYEIKNTRPDEICEKNPRAYINGLVNLKDVDTAKELLTGRKIYVQSDMAQVDDANSYSGYREVSIPVNTEATITAIGVGSQSYPVKIIFQDSQGHSYYLEVALSRTNSGMDVSDFQAEKKMRYFSNAISFSSKKSGNLETLKDKYIDLTVYPKRTLAVKRVFSLENKQMENRIHLPRYTVLKIKEVKISGPGSLVILSLEDRHGSLYETEVDLKYDVIVKNENYIEDLFGFGDIHQKYPAITDKRWAIIARGDLEEGMNTDECRLSIGDPVEIQLKKDSRFETWFYNGKTLEFESGILQRFK